MKHSNVMHSGFARPAMVLAMLFAPLLTASVAAEPGGKGESQGNVKSVDTRSFYRGPEVSPRNQSFHYHGNAETFMLVGEAMGKAMVELCK